MRTPREARSERGERVRDLAVVRQGPSQVLEVPTRVHVDERWQERGRDPGPGGRGGEVPRRMPRSPPHRSVEKRHGVAREPEEPEPSVGRGAEDGRRSLERLEGAQDRGAVDSRNVAGQDDDLGVPEGARVVDGRAETLPERAAPLEHGADARSRGAVRREDEVDAAERGRGLRHAPGRKLEERF